MDRPERCPNCDAELHGVFCNSCGQKNESSRLSTGEIAGGILEHVAELDLPIVRTVWGLTVNPGRVCLEYVAGHRKRFTNPMKYCFLAAAILLAVRAWMGSGGVNINLSTIGNPDTAMSEFASEIAQQTTSLFSQYLNWFNLLAVPIVALMLWGVIRRNRKTYAEHLSFALYVYGHIFLLKAILIVLDRPVPIRLTVFIPYLTLVYLSWAAWGMYRRSIWWSMLYAVLMFITFILMIVIFASILSLIILAIRLVFG